MVVIFCCNDTATTVIYTLSLHDALPICRSGDLVLPAWAHWHPSPAARPSRRSPVYADLSGPHEPACGAGAKPGRHPRRRQLARCARSLIKTFVSLWGGSTWPRFGGALSYVDYWQGPPRPAVWLRSSSPLHASKTALPKSTRAHHCVWWEDRVLVYL